MREIKFRAFEYNQMYYQVRVGGMFDNEPTAPTYWDEKRKDWIHLTGGQYTKVMQYTGIKGVNNIEICEGDIVSFYNDEEYKLEQTNALVIYESGAFMLEHKN